MSESPSQSVAPPKPLGALDAFFVYGETPSTMMHVAALMRFSPPPGGAPDHLARLVEEIRRDVVVQDPWNRKLKHVTAAPPPIQAWIVDPDFDLDYHFRHSALPAPGGERELGNLVSRLHSTPLDLERPPWEFHVIEGLAGGGFAIYVKLHHSLADGGTVLQMLSRGLPPDPDVTDTPIMFAIPPEDEEAPEAPEAKPGGLFSRIIDTITLPAKVAGSAASAVVATASVAGELGGAVGKYVRPPEGRDRPVLALQAPDTILNRRIGRNRRFATADLDLPLIKRIGKSRGATVNDVSLAVLGGALRRYLQDLDELPDRPLIAFVPISLRAPGDAGGGNAVGAMLVSLGTDVADPLARLDVVAASARAGKVPFEGLSQAAALAYSTTILGPAATRATMSTVGMPTPAPPTFNVSVSNVPGPREARYFRGSRLEGLYPVSIPYHSALNVTFIGYRDHLDFGFIGDRDAVPHLQRLAGYTREALAELSAAADGAAAPAG